MKEKIFRIVCLQMILSLIGCGEGSRASRPVVLGDLAPGRIILEVSSDTRIWRYEVTPNTGAVSELEPGIPQEGGSKHEIPVFATGEANCFFDGTEAKSPDDRFIAKCSGGYPGKSAEFLITNADSKSTTYKWDKGNRQILGFVWSPNSHSIGLLTSSQKRGNGPLELIWALAGHPVPYVTVYLDFIGMDGTAPSEYQIKSNVLYGRARILDWKR